MLFHSQPFILAFLPATLALYYVLARRTIAREWLLIAASLVFYGWWDVRFLPLLLAHVAITWLLARGYGQTGQRALLALGIAANLASLAVFKYLDFFAASLGALLGFPLPKSDIVLPIGISFFTFQCVSYLIDMRRGEAPQYPLRRFALFVMIFPHLIAGPIVRHNEIIPQFDRDPLREGLAERLVRGLTLFVFALVLKVEIADRLAVEVDRVFMVAATAVPKAADAWIAVVGFSLQIFFDFAAYSDMAIAIALMLGLHFPMNFNMPYRATSLREFWRRWHMSLSRFLRDYLYVPLGGSREGFPRFVLASLVTMGLCGLWHGAGWTFVAWGLVHGVGLIVCRAWSDARLPMPEALGWVLTMLFVALAFIIFRSPDVATVASMAAGLAGNDGLGAVEAAPGALLAIAAIIAVLPRPDRALVAPSPAMAALTALAATFIVVEVGRGAPTSFIYFQF